MSSKIFSVKYVTCKNCFCYFSSGNTNFLNNEVKFAHRNQVGYLTSQELKSLHINEIGLSPLYAKVLGLQEGDHVEITLNNTTTRAETLVVSPISADDYEILESLAADVEDTLLNQIRIVNVNQKFIIWISSYLHITVNVDRIEPKSPAYLTNTSELVVKSPGKVTNEKPVETWSLHNFFSNLIGNRLKEDNSLQTILSKYSKIPAAVFFLKPSTNLKNTKSQQQQYPFTVFVTKKSLPRVENENDLYFLKIIQNPIIVNNNFNDSLPIIKASLLVNVVFVEETDPRTPNLYVHSDIFSNFNLKEGSKGILEKSINVDSIVNTIKLIPTEASNENLIEKFQLFISGCSGKIALNCNFIMSIGSTVTFYIKFIPENVTYCTISSDLIRTCGLVQGEYDNNKKKRSLNGAKCRLMCTDLEYCKNIISNVRNLLQLKIYNTFQHFENILIAGKAGTGKSSIIELLSKEVFDPLNFHIEIVKCCHLKGKTLDSLHKCFSNSFANLIYFQPSVLVLDDLDVICEKVNESDTLTQEAIQFNRVSELIVNMIQSYLTTNNVMVIATTKSTLKINNEIISKSRGSYLFKNTFTIEDLTKTDRSTFIQFLLAQRINFGDIDFDKLAVNTEGFVAQDLVDFCDKAYFEAVKNNSSRVADNDCQIALSKTTALSLKDIKLHCPGEKNFSDIGGLDQAKKILMESLTWPLQYPNIFQKAPLRLQSGLLLYGPPGTGKTVLVSAAAKQFNIRLLSVKGPELLSKYIGASEQAVRNVFERAQTAAPCILFFDEFDSLAPRRGHDSTGVTDRVVNQLLTQLDGIETLRGVCILAATSRPDLLDSALLRPGRLDKQILCSLPDENSRRLILQSLSKALTFSSGIDLEHLAKNTEGYSGADLQAVLYTAQLLAAEKLLQNEEAGHCDIIVEITQEHLREALETTRPSLTPSERRKYERIYEHFQTGNIDPNWKAQKTTLA